MESSDEETLDHVKLMTSFTPLIGKKRASPHRLPTVQARNRKEQIAEATRAATEQRLLFEIQRPKYIFEELLISHVKPASYHINAARSKRKSINKTVLSTSSISPSRNLSPTSRETHRSPRSRRRSQALDRSITCKPEVRTSKDFMEKFYPEWLKSRHEFMEAYGRMREKIGLNIADICKRISSHRSEDEKEAVTRWLEQLDCFRDLPKENLKQLSDRFITCTFQPEETLMKQGDPGDCMFVLYKGTVDVLIDGVGKVGEIAGKVPVGEAAIKNNVNRSATIVAATAVTCLKLKKRDYADVLMTLKKSEKMKFGSFIQTIDFFQGWSPVKVQQLCSYLMLHKYKEGETIYKLGDSAPTFYIIMTGQVLLQAQVDVRQHHKWPVADREWELLSFINKFKVTVKTLTPGQFFGESEVINDWQRQTSAVAAVSTQCLIINRKELFEILTSSDLDKILSYNPLTLPSKKVLEQQILDSFRSRRKYLKALIDGADVDFSPSKRGVMTNRRSLKMQDWIAGLKERIREEHERVRQDIVESKKKTTRVLT